MQGVGANDAIHWVFLTSLWIPSLNIVGMNKGLVDIIKNGVRVNCFVKEKFSSNIYKCIKIANHYGETSLLCVRHCSVKNRLCDARMAYVQTTDISGIMQYSHNNVFKDLDSLCNDIVTYNGQEPTVLLGEDTICIKLNNKSYAVISIPFLTVARIPKCIVCDDFKENLYVEIIGNLRNGTIKNVLKRISSRRPFLLLWRLRNIPPLKRLRYETEYELFKKCKSLIKGKDER